VGGGTATSTRQGGSFIDADVTMLLHVDVDVIDPEVLILIVFMIYLWILTALFVAQHYGRFLSRAIRTKYKMFASEEKF
jgi:hypothetical protein